ncbi:hypothetical protein GCM10010116_31430 [Microbispora rosea subsp. aerata]|nr:hypothetical protein GCM10010116_31430 [Microbispora rosea subsp. aerata]GIH58655.1 hypothetical protein Mro02_55690 [Microbispora rosea subsp. aerata]GLJ86976.1 hypothetical protein GCM10017588_57190 [Microbispora rosea subsp. aerata]
MTRTSGRVTPTLAPNSLISFVVTADSSSPTPSHTQPPQPPDAQASPKPRNIRCPAARGTPQWPAAGNAWCLAARPPHNIGCFAALGMLQRPTSGSANVQPLSTPS